MSKAVSQMIFFPCAFELLVRGIFRKIQTGSASVRQEYTPDISFSITFLDSLETCLSSLSLYYVVSSRCSIKLINIKYSTSLNRDTSIDVLRIILLASVCKISQAIQIIQIIQNYSTEI